MWLRPTLVISLAVAVHAIEVLLDDECEGNECSLEMLHLRAKKMAVEKGSSAELQEVHGNNLQDEENSKKCLTWANCRNRFFNGIKCSGGRYCTKWGGGRVCKKYVSCRNGFFNGINCHGSRYCVTWGLLQEGEEESEQDIESQNQEADSTDGELNMQEENDLQNDNEENGKKCLTWANCRNGFFNGIKCSGGRYCTKWGGGRVCKKYVSCRNGFFNGINCHGSRYCVTWGLLQEGEEESAKDIESQNQEADSTDGELNMQEENDLQNENAENEGHCLSWANCRGGFWRGIRCNGGRYCTRWGGGGYGGRRRWRSGGRVCRKYVSCRNGFFNGINCHGSRYCVSWGLLQEGEEESAKDIESQNQEADSTDGELNMQEENDLQNDNEENGKKCLTWANCRNGFFNGIKCSGGRYCTKWGGGRVCKKYVSCRNGFFNGINCHGSRYCVTWGLLQEGEEESAQDIESQNQEADSTDGELNMQEENDLQNDNEENGKKCLTWANCRNGFFNGIKCSGSRYCTKWGGGGVMEHSTRETETRD